MPLSFSVPLPGPFRYSKTISGKPTAAGNGCLMVFFWMIVGPFLLAWAMCWWTLVLCFYIFKGILYDLPRSIITTIRQ